VAEKGAGRLVPVMQSALALSLGLVASAALFLFLPLMQSIRDPIPRDLLRVTEVNPFLPPPPPPPPEEEEPEDEEDEREQEPPKLVDEAPPLDLAQLELALNPGTGEGLFGDFTIRLLDGVGKSGDGEDDGLDAIFSLGELDQRPRVVFQRTPTYPPELRRSDRRGTVYVVFTVDTRGRVVDPRVDRSTDPAFEPSALAAVREWRFEPGTRSGEKVQFRMRVPITFNAG
jgi:protein TonB